MTRRGRALVLPVHFGLNYTYLSDSGHSRTVRAGGPMVPALPRSEMTRTFRLGSAALSILLVALSAALAPTAQAATGGGASASASALASASASAKPALAPT